VLSFTIAGVAHTETFLVAPIGVHSIILGMPWLENTNPLIDWKLKSVEPRTSEADYQAPVEPCPPVHEPGSHAAVSPSQKRSKKRRKSSRSSSPPSPSVAPPPDPPRLRERPKILLTTQINSNDLVFLVQVDSIEELNSVAAGYSPDPPEIPEQYRDLAEVFSKAKANALPPNRDHVDHAIPLEEGSKPVFGPIYNLSETELSVLKEYIHDNLASGFIRPST